MTRRWPGSTDGDRPRRLFAYRRVPGYPVYAVAPDAAAGMVLRKPFSRDDLAAGLRRTRRTAAVS